MPSANQNIAFCTVVTRSHLHYARVLADSLRATHFGAPLYVCVVDQPGQCTKDTLCQAVDPVIWLSGDSLSVPNWKRFAFQYSAFELCCALKPFLLEHVLQSGARRVVYLDADIHVYGPVGEVFDTAEHLSVGLTPHLHDPIPWDGKYPDERTILSAGVYNGGFIAVTDSAESRRFLGWWRERLYDKCVSDMARGMFVDQRWLDLVPGLFDHVRIHRRPGFHVAYWNLHNRWIEESAGGKWVLDGRPISFIHFSGINVNSPETISKHQNRLCMEAHPGFQTLLARYIRDLKAAGTDACCSERYLFDCLSDGTPIESSWREAVRTCHPLLENIDDPFDATATPNLVNLLARASLGPAPFVKQERQATEMPTPVVRRSFSPLRDMGRLFRATISRVDRDLAQDVVSVERAAAGALLGVHRPA